MKDSIKWFYKFLQIEEIVNNLLGRAVGPLAQDSRAVVWKWNSEIDKLISINNYLKQCTCLTLKREFQMI